MKIYFTLLLITQLATTSAQASENCNSLLSDHLAASIQNLAELRVDLDMQIAAGNETFLIRTMTLAFERKKSEILSHMTNRGIEASHLGIELKKKIATIQNKVEIQAQETAELRQAQASKLDNVVQGLSVVGQLIEPRQEFGILKISDRHILIVGGHAPFKLVDERSSIELYDIETHQSEIIGHMESGRRIPKLKLQPDGTVLVWGGYMNRLETTVVDVVDPILKTIHRLSEPKSFGNFAMPNGKSVWIDGPDLVIYSENGELENRRKEKNLPSFHGRGLSQSLDGSLFLTGGDSRGTHDVPSVPLRQILKVDGSTLEVKITSAMKHYRGGHAQLSLADGSLLLSGGTLDHVMTSLIEKVNPNTGESIEVGRLLVPRTDHRMLALSDSLVVILGGRTQTSPKSTWEGISTVELVDLTTGFSEKIGDFELDNNSPIPPAVLTSKGLLLFADNPWNVTLIR